MLKTSPFHWCGGSDRWVAGHSANHLRIIQKRRLSFQTGDSSCLLFEPTSLLWASKKRWMPGDIPLAGVEKLLCNGPKQAHHIHFLAVPKGSTPCAEQFTTRFAGLPACVRTNGLNTQRQDFSSRSKTQRQDSSIRGKGMFSTPKASNLEIVVKTAMSCLSACSLAAQESDLHGCVCPQ